MPDFDSDFYGEQPIDLGDNIDIGGGWNPGADNSYYDPGDNIDQGGGWNPLTGQAGAGGSIDAAWLANLAGGAGGSGMDWTKILRSLGLMTGKDNSLMPLLSLLGIGGGALLKNNAAKDATRDISGAVTSANDMLTKMLAGSTGNFTPYTTAGANAAGLAPGLAYKPMAGQFKPLGSGAALTMSNMMKRGK